MLHEELRHFKGKRGSQYQQGGPSKEANGCTCIICVASPQNACLISLHRSEICHRLSGYDLTKICNSLPQHVRYERFAVTASTKTAQPSTQNNWKQMT